MVTQETIEILHSFLNKRILVKVRPRPEKNVLIDPNDLNKLEIKKSYDHSGIFGSSGYSGFSGWSSNEYLDLNAVEELTIKEFSENFEYIKFTELRSYGDTDRICWVATQSFINHFKFLTVLEK